VARRPRKEPGKHLRKARDQCAVPSRGSDRPDATRHVRRLATDGDADVLGQGDLALERSGAAPDVSDRVPGFLDDQHPPGVVTNEDVDRQARVASADRQFEPTGAPSRGCEPEEQLLHLQMTCVDGFLSRIASELEPHVPAECRRESHPNGDRHTATFAQLDPADLALAEVDDLAQPRLRQASTDASRPDITTESLDDGIGQSIALDVECGAPGAASRLHTDRMVTQSPGPPVIDRLAGDFSPLASLAPVRRVSEAE